MPGCQLLELSSVSLSPCLDLSLLVTWFVWIFNPLNVSLLQEAALVLNASRRFRYTLDVKKEERKEEVRRKIRAHSTVIRVSSLRIFFLSIFITQSVLAFFFLCRLPFISTKLAGPHFSLEKQQVCTHYYFLVLTLPS